MDQVSRALLAAGGGVAEQTYVDDVFSTHLYTGNGSTQTITNGIDLAGKGGMVWFKARSAATNHYLYDTVRGANKALYSNDTPAEVTTSTSMSFNSNGVSITENGIFINSTSHIYTSWTFRKAPKFFDVVTYTGNGSINQVVNHSLGTAPGVIIVKAVSAGSNAGWLVYHRSLGYTKRLVLNRTSAPEVTDGNIGYAWGTTGEEPTAATFTVGDTGGDPSSSESGISYVAYLFAHDTAADGLIQCDSFTTDGSGNATVTSLGWEPQFLMVKAASTTGDWIMLDSMRGWNMTAADARLLANSSAAETTAAETGNPTATGFSFSGGSASATYIYIAIRRPNKPPTTGTQVFQPTVYTGTNVDNRLIDTTIAPDMVWLRQRNGSGTGYEGFVVGDRLRGQPWLKTALIQAETTTADGLDQQLVSTTEYGTAFSAMNGIWVGNSSGASATAANINANTTTNNHIALAFKRAPGFFDVVCYAGTGAQLSVAHNLGAVPELMIVARRIAGADNGWPVWTGGAVDQIMWLNLNLQRQTFANNFPAAPTASAFTVGSGLDTGASGGTYVAYLFASLPGVSKVGTFTTTGAVVNIDCGFLSSPRFVLRKPINTSGSWLVFDSARGIVAGTDPLLATNLTSAESSSGSYVAPISGGFSSDAEPAGTTYIYLAIA